MPRKKTENPYITQIETITENYRKAKKDLVAEAKVVFTDLTKKIFEDFPELESFGWTQYTPYWNDGDTCTFGVNADAESIFINGIDGYGDTVNGDDEDYDEAEENADEEQKESEQIGKAREFLDEFLNAIDEEMLEEWFGDHCTVVIHKNGKAKIHEYEHE